MIFKKVSEDTRRTIYANDKLLKDKKEISFIKLKSGKGIGGCKHNDLELCMLISGMADILLDDLKLQMLPNHVYQILPKMVHGFKAKDECIIMEWGITAEEKKNSSKSKKMLNKLNKINEQD